MKITGHLERVQQVVDGIESRTTVTELDIRQNQSRRPGPPDRKRVATRPRDADDLAAEVFDQRLEVERSQSFVLDDKDVSCDLGPASSRPDSSTSLCSVRALTSRIRAACSSENPSTEIRRTPGGVLALFGQGFVRRPSHLLRVPGCH
jgi:hypothetical protein